MMCEFMTLADLLAYTQNIAGQIYLTVAKAQRTQGLSTFNKT